MLRLRQIPHFPWHWKMVSNADKKESSQIFVGKRLVINKISLKSKKHFNLNKHEVGYWLYFELSVWFIFMHILLQIDFAYLRESWSLLTQKSRSTEFTLQLNWVKRGGINKESSLFLKAKSHTPLCTLRTRGNTQKRILSHGSIKSLFRPAI